MSIKTWFETNFPTLAHPGITDAGYAAARAMGQLNANRAIRRAPSREDFAIWRDDPTTRFVFMALRSAQDAQRKQWMAASWEGSIADPLLLRELQTRADAYYALEAATYEGFCEWAGLEPAPQEEAA